MTRYVDIERSFGFYWLSLIQRSEGDKIGTSQDRGFALTLRGARRRAKRILSSSRDGYAERVFGAEQSPTAERTP